MRLLVIVVALALVGGVSAALWLERAPDTKAPASRSSEIAADRTTRASGPSLDGRTRRHLGTFALRRGGRQIRIATADTVEGSGCLIEEQEGAESSSCLGDGLFASRRAELMVSSEGGPDRFDELHVVGVAAPGVRNVVLVKSDGTTVSLAFNMQRAFFFESPAADLAARVYPSALRLVGASGKVLETVDFPAAG